MAFLSFIGGLRLKLHHPTVLEQVHEDLMCRAGVDTNQSDHQDEHCGCFSRGESKNLIGEPDANADHEQATKNHP